MSIGSASVNVRNFGAMGNGSTDDTAAIQAAVNALPSTGGTVEVPAGTYMINALKAVNLRSHTRLLLDTGATLQAIPNSATRYWVVKAWNVNNVEIAGGTILGERSRHLGTTGEWGYGVNVSGSSYVYIHDISVANCWGDGLMVGATGSGTTVVPSYSVTLNNVKSNNNRRQGLSILPSTQVYVVNSSFTGSNGTLPQAGIDIEPQTQGLTRSVRLENTTLSNNVGNGLEVHLNVSDLTLNKVTAQNNHGFGVYTGGPSGVVITNSNITTNYLFGISISSGTHNVQIAGNTIQWNYALWFYQHNQSPYNMGWTPRDISIASTATNVTTSNNLISPMK
ncbi:right-handed parallel beta-helix repeat-containing protein [Dyella choica]|uniref:right-handed parallel beta-helix repeat-containing protein n=1 Tax=Dyella choica TaxID=1927959 RepID=UPI0013151FDD|nr:right-handed parallel beta-helix repeat-containing protein [Dyella choica]